LNIRFGAGAGAAFLYIPVFLGSEDNPGTKHLNVILMIDRNQFVKFIFAKSPQNKHIVPVTFQVRFVFVYPNAGAKTECVEECLVWTLYRLRRD
jgi:hypothetical protein